MNIAVICAGGKGKRMLANKNKVFLNILDKPIIYHTVKCFEDHKEVDKIVIVTGEDDVLEMQQALVGMHKVASIVVGGKERQDSVYNGIKAAANISQEGIVLVHNGANPLVKYDTITNTIKEAKEHGASVAAVRVKDTIRQVSEDNFSIKTLDRKKLWAMQTPQVIKINLAMKAFNKAMKDNYYSTDDVALVEYIGGKVKIVECSYENIKITTPEDIEIAENILGMRKC